MYRIAVLGDSDSIKGFGALGLDIFPVDTPEEALAKLHKLDGGQYAVIYITEKLASHLTREIEAYEEQVVPAVIVIPGLTGNTGMGLAAVSKSVERAVGSDILFDK